MNLFKSEFINLSAFKSNNSVLSYNAPLHLLHVLYGRCAVWTRALRESSLDFATVQSIIIETT